MVKCCGFVEFQRELGKKMKKRWKFAKNLVQNVEFFYHLEISLPWCSELVDEFGSFPIDDAELSWHSVTPWGGAVIVFISQPYSCGTAHYNDQQARMFCIYWLSSPTQIWLRGENDHHGGTAKMQHFACVEIKLQWRRSRGDFDILFQWVALN